MAKENDIDRVWSMIEKIGICLLVTRDGEALRARPMGAFVRKDEGAIYLLTNKGSEKEAEAAAAPQICLAFKGSGQDYVSISGTARLSDNRAKIRDLWTPFAKAWWDGPEDPAIRLLTVTPHEAEMWESPGKAVAYVAMLAAAVTGTKPAIGENRKISM